MLRDLLRLLHPMTPFITEELWHKLPGADSFLAAESWPRCDESKIDPAAEREIELLREVVVKIRNLRAESNIDPSRRIEVLLQAGNGETGELFRSQGGLMASLVRAESVRLVDGLKEGLIAARGTVGSTQIAVPLEGLLDLDAERARLRKELAKVERELQGRARKLNNASFMEKAPPEVVDKERRLHQELAQRLERLEQHLATLGNA